MTCDHFKALIGSAAAAEELDKALANHSEQCPDCHAALRREQWLLARADVALRARLSEEPTPGFFAQVCAAISEEAPAQWNLRWVLACASLALALLTVAGLRIVPRTQPIATKSLPTPTIASPAQRALVAPMRTPIMNARIRDGKERPSPEFAASRRQSNSEPEVLVPPDEAKAFQQFVTRLAEGREVAQAFVNGPANAEDDLDPIPPVEIADLWLQPLIWERWK